SLQPVCRSSWLRSAPLVCLHGFHCRDRDWPVPRQTPVPLGTSSGAPDEASRPRTARSRSAPVRDSSFRAASGVHPGRPAITQLRSRGLAEFATLRARSCALLPPPTGLDTAPPASRRYGDESGGEATRPCELRGGSNGSHQAASPSSFRLKK